MPDLLVRRARPVPIEQLESALDAYPGTLLLVTHDRRMLEAVHTTRHVAVVDGTVTG
jgi:ATPase subunit of ABC transporter with duplicated ATPase domains